MAKEEKKDKGVPKKLEKEWIAYVIDITAGPSLMMINMRYPDKATRLNNIIIEAINNYHKDFKDKITDPMAFTDGIIRLIGELVMTYSRNHLRKCLVDGMPKRPVIIQPGQMPPMGRA